MERVAVARYHCGEKETDAAKALAAWLDSLAPDGSYLPMMQYRVAGKAADRCEDTYYIAVGEGKALARLWNGWGKHPGAVGNFGNFFTVKEARGQGIGRKLLDAWYEDLLGKEERPIGLFCSAANTFLLDLYGGYGFTQAVILPEYSMLYKPLDGSPAAFSELCEDYYCSAKSLSLRPASVEWRHEIDCLLKFALAAEGERFGFPGCASLEETVVWPHIGQAGLLFTEKDRPVGWSFTPVGGETRWQIHPKFRTQFAQSGLEQSKPPSGSLY